MLALLGSICCRINHQRRSIAENAAHARSGRHTLAAARSVYPIFCRPISGYTDPPSTYTERVASRTYSLLSSRIAAYPRACWRAVCLV
ncbi:hypothetical protein EVAR_35657_1 [Eumeta japonica]|uniref:Uncharacterized protein n=1 Tax=Eumeta variegata TaxID=151549 RepID=A0A4C1VGW7_EUMVA|nr:hypothetical protein EVAR_35657_1 [Eumeta japonica]